MVSNRFSAWIVTALLIAAGARFASFVSTDPLLALANNYDMVRVQGCIDAYPVRFDGWHPAAISYEAPLERYRFRDDVESPCYFTSEAIFAWLVWPLARIESALSADAAFSLRIVGATKAIFLLGLLAIAAARLARSKQSRSAAIAVALVGATVLADPALLLYSPGFYAEFASLYFLAGVILGLLCLDGAHGIRVGGIVVCVMLLGLATSKVQHMALGVILAALYAASLSFTRSKGAGLATALLAAGSLGLLMQLGFYGREDAEAMRRANLTHTVLSTLFVVSNDASMTARHLGLPLSCADHAGKNWYSPGLQEHAPCPELYSLSRFRVLSLAVVEPSTFWRTFGGGFARLRPWIPSGLGVVAGERMGRLPQDRFTLARILDRLPAPAVSAVLFLPALLVAAATRSRSFRRLQPGVVFAWLALALLPYPIMGAIVFGDGYLDTPKQGVLVFACVLSFWVALAAVVVSRVARVVRAGPAPELQRWSKSASASAERQSRPQT